MTRSHRNQAAITIAVASLLLVTACSHGTPPKLAADSGCASIIDAGAYTLTIVCPEAGGAGVCDAHAQIDGGPAFAETTADFGIAGLSFGNVFSVDLDGDGYPDLVGCGGGQRETIPTVDAAGGMHNLPDGGFLQLVAVLMNRPKPDGGRMFVDETAQSGLFQVRDGSTTQYREAEIMAFADVNNDGTIDAFSGIAFGAANFPPLPSTLPADQNEILLNDGHGHFTLAPSSGPSQVIQPGLNQSIFTDVDNDGNLDLFLTYWTPTENGDMAFVGSQAQLLKGAGDGTFTLATPAGMTTNDKDTSLSARGINATIANILAGTDPRPSFGAAACDLNGDGYPELLISSYGGQSNMLYVNDGTGNFTRQVDGDGGFDGDSDVDYRDNWYYECYCVDPLYKDTAYCADAGRPPICCQGTCSNEPSVTCTWDPTDCGGACPLGGTCTGIAANIEASGGWNRGFSDQPAVLNGNNFGATCRDVNGDGVPDIWEGTIRHEWAGQSTDESALLINTTPQSSQGGPISWSRLDAGAVGIVLPHWDFPDHPQGWNEGIEQNDVADMDNDGYPDIIAPASDYAYQYLHIFKQLPGFHFQDMAFAWGLQVPCMSLDLVADLDRRGSLALVENEAGYNQCGICGPGQTSSSETCGGWPATDAGAPAFTGGWANNALHVFSSNAGQTANWLAIRLRAGSGTNAMGIGARVTVTANGVSQMQDMLGGKVIASRSDDPGVLFFGLGACAAVDTITVRWPNKTLNVDTWKNVPAKKLIELHAGDSTIYSVDL